MAKFSFRLQKVLEYRELEEGWAKDAYLTAQRVRTEQESEISELLNQRQAILQVPVHGLEGRRHLDTFLIKMEDDLKSHRIVLSILENEELSAQAEWNIRRQAVKALTNLRDRAREEWMLEESRKEQAELDEWAVLRRVA